MEDAILIRELSADEATTRVLELADVIRDSVDGGASVNFLAGVTIEECRDFWLGSIAEQRRGDRVLFVADTGQRIVATALLILAPQQNQQHRADVGKMLVHSQFRQRGLARQLLVALEDEALRRKRTLLMLDTAKDTAGDKLYAATGWTRYGEVPGHAMMTDGTPWPTSFYYKVLSR